jgi:hypothetical protein
MTGLLVVGTFGYAIPWTIPGGFLVGLLASKPNKWMMANVALFGTITGFTVDSMRPPNGYATNLINWSIMTSFAGTFVGHFLGFGIGRGIRFIFVRSSKNLIQKVNNFNEKYGK